MELLSWELTTRLSARHPTKILALRQHRVFIAPFLVYAALRVAWGRVSGSIRLLHLGDPVLAPLASLARLLGIPVCVTVHGLDVVFSNALYQRWLRLFFPSCDGYICITAAVKRLAIAWGVPANRTFVVGVGVTVPLPIEVPRDPYLILFIGRMVHRKGLGWFIGQVLPRVAELQPEARLVVIGEGPEREGIERVAEEKRVADRILWLGRVADTEKWRWLHRASIVVMPNVKVANDFEGFGVVALEAMAAGCCVLIADADGLSDAVGGGRGGVLLPAEDSDQWVISVNQFQRERDAAKALGERSRAWVQSERTWEQVCDAYEAVFDVLAPRKQA